MSDRVTIPESDTRFLMLVKGDERYVFVYDVADQQSKSECLRTLGRFASNPELAFSWYDAAMLSQEVRKAAIEMREATQ